MPIEPLLSVRDVHVSYGRVAALHGVSLEVHEGEVVALVGANGAGKTTLLRTVSGLMKPRRGQVRLRGRRIDGRAPSRIVRDHIAHVPEGRRVFPRFDVRDNLRIGGYSRPDFSTLGPEIADVLAANPALARRADSPGGALSGGEQQLLAIHRALMSRPTLLLLDEPSMGLAPVLVDAVLDLVSTLNAKGTTVLLVEQNAVAALEISHRAYVLSAGTIAMEGPASEFVNSPDFAASYLGIGP